MGLTPRNSGKDLENKPSSSQLPMSLKVDDVVVTDKKHMAELFNHHFIKSGFLFDSTIPSCPSNISSSPTPSNATSPYAPPSLQAVTESELLNEPLKLDSKNNLGLDPFFCKVAAPIIAKPIFELFNMCLLPGEVPIAWKAATMCGGDQAESNSYRPISISLCLSKVLEKLVNNQLTGFLDVYSILSGM